MPIKRVKKDRVYDDFLSKYNNIQPAEAIFEGEEFDCVLTNIGVKTIEKVETQQIVKESSPK